MISSEVAFSCPYEEAASPVPKIQEAPRLTDSLLVSEFRQDVNHPINSEASVEYFIDVGGEEPAYIIGRKALALYILEGADPQNIHDLNNLLLAKESVPYDFSESWRGKDFTKEKAIRNGKFILSILKSVNPIQSLTKRIQERSYWLGLNYRTDTMIRKDRFGSVANYQKAIGDGGARKWGQYKHLTFEDLVVHIQNIAREEGGVVSVPILERRTAIEGRDEPSRSQIGQLIKPRKISELIEAAEVSRETTHGWDVQRFENWGVDYMWANQGHIPTRITMQACSRKNVGPTKTGAVDRYGSLINFQATLTEKFQEDFENRFQELLTAVHHGKVPSSLFENTNTIWDVFGQFYTYQIVQELCNSFADDRMVVITKAVTNGGIKTTEYGNPKKLTERIFESAKQSGVFNICWPQKSGIHFANPNSSRVADFTPDESYIKRLKEATKNSSWEDFESRRNKIIKGPLGYPMRVMEPYTLEEAMALYKIGVKVPLDLVPNEFWREPGQPFHRFSEEVLGEDF